MPGWILPRRGQILHLARDPVQAELRRLREAAQVRLRAEAWQTYICALAGLEALVNAIGLPDATAAMNEAATDTVRRAPRTARGDQFRMSNNLAALMALVADLSESSEGDSRDLIFQRGMELTALTVGQLRELLITLLHAPKSSRES